MHVHVHVGKVWCVVCVFVVWYVHGVGVVCVWWCSVCVCVCVCVNGGVVCVVYVCGGVVCIW